MISELRTVNDAVVVVVNHCVGGDAGAVAAGAGRPLFDGTRTPLRGALLRRARPPLPIGSGAGLAQQLAAGGLQGLHMRPPARDANVHWISDDVESAVQSPHSMSAQQTRQCVECHWDWVMRRQVMKLRR